MINRLLIFIKKHEHSVFLVLSGLLGLAPLSWFRGLPITGEEFYAVNYAKWVGIFSKAWEPYMNYGESTILMPLKLQGLFFYLLKNIGISLYTSQLLWYVFLWVLTGIVCYLFLSKLFEKTVPPFILFVATIYYVYNPFFLNISPFLTPPRMVFIALPVVLSILYSIFKQNKVLPKEMFNFALVLFLVSPVFVNLPAGIAILLLIALGVLYKYLILDKNYKNFFISVAYLVVFCGAVSLWWFIPIAAETISSSGSIKSTASAFTAVSSSRINDVLSQFGSWAFREKIYGYDYYYFTYNQQYDSMPLLLLRYIPYLFIVFGILYLVSTLRSKKELSTQEEFFIFVLLIFGIFTFLSKGSSGILGGVYQFMYIKVPFFWVFREPYAKFVPVVSSSSLPLIILGYVYVTKLLTAVKNIKLIVPALLAICFFAIGYPIWNGDVLWTINDGDVRSYELQMPKYWQEFTSKWEPENGYYLLFPSIGMTDRYMWPSGYIGNPYLLFTNARTINPVSSYVLNQGVQQVINYIYDKVFHDPKWLADNAERYNISGIVFQGDIADHAGLLKRDALKHDYNNFLTSVFDKIDLYTFTPQEKKSSDFTHIPENKLFWIDKVHINNYKAIKSVVPQSAYFVFSDDSEKFNFYIISEDEKTKIVDSRLETFSLNGIKKDTYSVFIDDKYRFIEEISADAAVLPYSFNLDINTFDLKMDANCCNYINLKVKAPAEIAVEEDWTLLQKIDAQHYGRGAMEGNRLDLGTTSNAYYKKLTGYDPAMEHFITLEGNYVGTNGFSVFTTRRELDLQTESSLVGGNLNELNGQIGFTLQKRDLLNISSDYEHYVVIRKPEPLGGGSAKDTPSQDYLDLTSIRFYRIFHPSVILVKKDILVGANAGDVTSYEQKKIDDTLILTKVIGDNGYLQFKNSYNKGWRLVKLDDSAWENENKTLLSIKASLKAFSGRQPVNIEYYSNAWKLDSPGVYAVVFLPEVKVRLLLMLAVATLIVGAASLKRKK